MAILGFPSSAIIGDLNWTGANVDLAASDFIQIFCSVGTEITAPGPIANSSISVTSGNGVTLATDDEASLLRLNVNAEGIAMSTDGPMNIGSTGNVNVTATETLNLTGGNLISGGVSITTPQILNLGGETGVDIQSQQGVYLIAPLFQHNGANVATQSFSIAMAIALG